MLKVSFAGEVGRASAMFALSCLSATTARAQIYSPSWQIGGGYNRTGTFQGFAKVALAPNRFLYVADSQTIRKFTRAGKQVADWSLGNYGSPYGANDLGVDNAGNLFLSTGSGYIIKFKTNGSLERGFSLPKQEKSGEQTWYFSEFAVTGRGDVYAIDAKRRQVAVFDKTGAFRFAFGGRGDRTLRYGRLTLKNGQFGRPNDITLDTKGNVYVSDYFGGVQKFSAAGKYLARIDGFSNPTSVAVDRAGNLYVGDTLQNRVQIFNTKGKLISKFSAPGRNSSYTDGLVVDEKGDVYMSESGNDLVRVRKFRHRTLAP